MPIRKTRSTRRRLLRTLAANAVGLPLGCRLLTPGRAIAAEHPTDDRQAAQQIEDLLNKNILASWYPRCLDREHGGFHEHFAEDWSRLPGNSKFLVFQARMTWTPAAVIAQYPKRKAEFEPYLRHGLSHLADRMWDDRYGGFFDRIDDAGRPDPNNFPIKQLYAESFGIYAAATAYRAMGDRAALELAQKAFRWLDTHAHDPEHGGYHEHLTRDGRRLTPQLVETEAKRPVPAIGHVGQKSMNAHIHLLEALTTLAGVWDDPLVRQRLVEVFEIVRDKITLGEGHLAMFTAPDFKPLDERNSFGHQLEMAFLLLEAEEVLGRHEDRTHQVARKLVDHSLRFGWDDEHGGFFDEGPPNAPATRRHKVWWVQPEGLNGLLAVDRMLKHKDPRYRQTFDRTWSFFRDHLVDHRHGGCFEVTDESGEPLPGRRHKATPWKTAYHVVRSLLFASRELGG